jgi:hypothetical protein
VYEAHSLTPSPFSLRLESSSFYVGTASPVFSTDSGQTFEFLATAKNVHMKFA